MNREVLEARAAPMIVSARLMILQSKRLMLSSLERRLEDSTHSAPRERVERLREETARAQNVYRSSLVTFGSPENADYWPAAYNLLIETGTILTTKLRSAVQELPPAQRYEVATDVQALEYIIDGWTKSMRSAIATAAS